MGKNIAAGLSVTRFIGICGCVLLTVLLSGCFMQSIHPFYTDASLVDVPEISGSWRLISQGSEDLSGKYREPWHFGKDKIETYEKGVNSSLDVKYFRVEGTLFADLISSKPDETKGPNFWWMLHVLPMHSVCRVHISGDTVSFTPLNGDWLTRKLKDKAIALPFIYTEDTLDHPVLAASSGDLMAFLKIYRDNAEAFPKDNAFKFIKDTPAGKANK